MTLADLVDQGEATRAAIGAPDRSPMSYAQLRGLRRHLMAGFARHGLGANDRIAIVLANGPEMATSFIIVASLATAAPLNPAYTAVEFEYYLSDLKPKAIVIAVGEATPARDVATRRGIPIIELDRTVDAPAGTFDLDFGGIATRPLAKIPRDEDIALVLHTSGTTSRPKIVPLSQRNLCASAHNVSHTLALLPDDRCLNIMPLFHIHGLIAAVLSSLYAGACVSCTTGFNAMKFFAWMAAEQPTWFSAVPTMHQAILARAQRNQTILARSRVRFIRSSSASLPSPVMQQLEETFSCPVIESYGMTEAAHQMTSNRLPPGQRKSGSVGAPAGPEVRLMDPSGAFTVGAAAGEIVIRGANVTPGYDANRQANADAFAADPDGGDDWFRTGDQGIFDADGFLTISGRLKEIINRGGEKIAPREVDEVLMDHAAVAQVVTFAMAHPKLGEDVAAAVVLREGTAVTERELRDFAAKSLVAFKVPRKIVFLDEIPTGATGKLQRIGLAAKLGLG
ncbi:MAG: AMP-dependent synthetase [Proteobacteria bacterium]|nr:MAG: AMP-dependent synthetase [Pseudomonadota bacterium]